MDVDDVGAICIAHALQSNDEAKLLAIVQDTTPHGSVGVISVLNTYYNHTVPIGQPSALRPLLSRT